MSKALVLGGAGTVWAEVEAALELGEFDGIVGANAIGSVWPGRLDAWVSQHADWFERWRRTRDALGLPMHRQVLAAGTATSYRNLDDCITGFVDHRFPGQERSGSSGLFALKVALVDLGFDKAVLCGVPMRNGASHITHPGEAWRGERSHRPGWIEALPQIKERVRSMSGWTAELLGRPTEEWLHA